MNDVDFETYSRSLLNDSPASMWSAAEFAALKAVAITLVNANFWNLLFPLKKWPILYSLAVGENYLDLPVGWHKVVRVERPSDGVPLKPISDMELPDYLNADSSFYTPGGIAEQIAFGPSVAWIDFAEDNYVPADGGLTWGAEEYSWRLQNPPLEPPWSD